MEILILLLRISMQITVRFFKFWNQIRHSHSLISFSHVDFYSILAFYHSDRQETQHRTNKKSKTEL